jgi:integrase
MATIKLTEKKVAQLRAPDASGKQKIFWDATADVPRGFGLLVSGTTAAKTYIVERAIGIGGKKRRVTVAAYGELPLADARRKAINLIHLMRNGHDPKLARRSGATLRSALDSYLAANRMLSEGSRRNYRNAVERYLTDLADKPLREITPETVAKRHEGIAKEVEQRELAAAKATAHDLERRAAAIARSYPDAARRHRARAKLIRRREPRRGEAAANGAMRALRVLWNFAAESDPDLPAHPVRALRRSWFKVERRTRVVAVDDLAKFYRGVNDLPNKVARDYLLLLLFTGLRRTEAATLTWDDVDLTKKVISIPGERTKSGRKLDLPMTTFVRDLLVKRRSEGRARFVFVAESKSGHIAEPKFPLKLVAEATGIKVSVHDLRRTFITVAESADISPLALKALVNHSVGGDVTAGYVQMNPERLREPAQRVCDRLIELCRIPPGETGIRVVKGLKEAEKA